MLLIPQWYEPFSPQQVWMFFQWSMTFQFFIRLNEAESKLKCTILDDWQVFLFLISHAYEYHGDITPILNEYLHVSIKYSYSCISNIVPKINQRRMRLGKVLHKTYVKEYQTINLRYVVSLCCWKLSCII